MKLALALGGIQQAGTYLLTSRIFLVTSQTSA